MRFPFHDLFFLPPVLADSLGGEPVEEVLLMRDEVAGGGRVLGGEQGWRCVGAPDPGKSAYKS